MPAAEHANRRRTAAANLIDAEVSVEKVAALLGNSNLNTTRIYIIPNVSPATSAASVEVSQAMG